MPTKYIPTPHGFISNAPRVQFERCDGKRFYSETATAGSVTSTDNTTAVYGGWGKTPLGFVDGDSSAEITVSDTMFQLDMFELGGTGTMTNQEMTPVNFTETASSGGGDLSKISLAGDDDFGRIQFVGVTGQTLEQVDTKAEVVSGKYYADYGDNPALGFVDIYFDKTDVAVGSSVTATCLQHTGTDIGIMSGGNYTVGQYNNVPTVELPFLIYRQNGITVNGVKIIPDLKNNTWPMPVSGKVNMGTTYNDDKSTRLGFSSSDVTIGDTIQLMYQRRATWVSVLTVLTTGSTARGSLTLTWPVMSSGTDCTQNAIIGFYHMKIPRVMVTQRPSLDTSRSTAATPQIVFSAIDAHRGDKKWYDLVYEPLDDGMPITEYGNEPFVWEN